MKIIKGNLLNATEQYIIHQCNCVTDKPKGLSKAMFDKFPFANVYKNHKQKRSKPGTIRITQNVVALFGQYYPGRAKYANDSKEMRINWFRECLEQIARIANIKSCAFPFKIGCGLAGGNWDEYLKLLKDFETKNPNIQIVLYQLE